MISSEEKILLEGLVSKYGVSAILEAMEEYMDPVETASAPVERDWTSNWTITVDDIEAAAEATPDPSEGGGDPDDQPDEEDAPREEPDEFTGIASADRFLGWCVYRDDPHNLFCETANTSWVRDRNGRPTLEFIPLRGDDGEVRWFNPLSMAQKPGNIFNTIWFNIVDYIKRTPRFDGMSAFDKDRYLVNVFVRVLRRNLKLGNRHTYEKNVWYEETKNRCMEKWRHLVKIAPRVYPDRKAVNERRRFVTSRYDDFITKEGVYKYAIHWKPEFSKSFPIE